MDDELCKKLSNYETLTELLADEKSTFYRVEVLMSLLARADLDSDAQAKDIVSQISNNYRIFKATNKIWYL